MPGVTNRVFMGQLKVEYFRIQTFGKEAPLTVKIIQDEANNRKNAVTVYTSFKTDYPDTENNDGKYDIGRIKIYPTHSTKHFNNDHCSFAVFSRYDAVYCIAYYFENEPQIQMSTDKEMTLNKMVVQIDQAAKVRVKSCVIFA